MAQPGPTETDDVHPPLRDGGPTSRAVAFLRSALLGRPAGAFTAADVPDQTGRTVLVTGATSGLGLRSAQLLARAGARVLLTARDPGRGEVAFRRVAATASGPVPELVALDLADLTSVAAAAADVAARVDRLDLVLANAGVMATPPGRTVDGFETQIGTNHLGHFALVGRLLPLLRPGPGPVPRPRSGSTPDGTPRVVVVTSPAHRIGRVVVSDLNGEGRRYSAWGAYGQSKLANLLFMRELQHRADEHGRSLLAAAAHPGFASTGLVASSNLGTGVLRPLARFGTDHLAQSPEAGVLPQVYAATMPDVRPLEVFGPAGPGQWAGAAVRVPVAPTAHDDVTAAALWIVSEQLTGVTYEWS